MNGFIKQENKHIAFGVFAVVVIAGLELCALKAGFNGTALALSIAGITAIAGGIIGFKLGKVTVEK